MIVEIQAIIPLKKTTALSMEFRLLGTGSLAPANFSGAVFTCAHFQKLAQISSLCDFHYIPYSHEQKQVAISDMS